jgi:sodium transport system permease protein
MLSNSWIVARKELLDHLRDGRALASAALYILIIVGKWLAASVFAVGGLLANVLAFGFVLASSAAMPDTTGPLLLLMIPALLTLALAAAALQILVSTLCRSLKEVNTYLSLMIFVVMGIGMWLAFRPQAAAGWWFLAPIAGQQVLMQRGLATGAVPVLESLILTATTAAGAILALVYAGRLMKRDAIVYGN